MLVLIFSINWANDPYLLLGLGKYNVVNYWALVNYWAYIMLSRYWAYLLGLGYYLGF